jgi:hypothetical protein
MTGHGSVSGALITGLQAGWPFGGDSTTIAIAAAVLARNYRDH